MQRPEGRGGAARSQDQRMAWQQGSDQLTVRMENKRYRQGAEAKRVFLLHSWLGTSSSRQRRVTGGLRTGSGMSRVCFIYF